MCVYVCVLHVYVCTSVRTCTDGCVLVWIQCHLTGLLSLFLLSCDQGTSGSPCSSGTQWTQVPGNLKQLDVGEDIVIGVNNNDEIFYRTGITYEQPTGSNWAKLEGSLKHVTVSPRGAIWGVNSANTVGYCME